MKRVDNRMPLYTVHDLTKVSVAQEPKIPGSKLPTVTKFIFRCWPVKLLLVYYDTFIGPGELGKYRFLSARSEDPKKFTSNKPRWSSHLSTQPLGQSER